MVSLSENACRLTKRYQQIYPISHDPKACPKFQNSVKDFIALNPKNTMGLLQTWHDLLNRQLLTAYPMLSVSGKPYSSTIRISSFSSASSIGL